LITASLLLPFSLLQSEDVNAWDWDTHAAMVDAVFYSFDWKEKEQFNLTLMEDGSVAPDRDFRDNSRHHYPPAYGQALLWLERMRAAIERGDFENASYDFGVATHYISDSFSAPHYIKGESWQLHSEYEKLGSSEYEFFGCTDIGIDDEDADDPNLDDLEAMMAEGVEHGKTWNKWLDGKNKEIPVSAVARSFKVVAAVAVSEFNAICNHEGTEFDRRFEVGWLTVVLAVILILIMIFVLVSLIREFL